MKQIPVTFRTETLFALVDDEDFELLSRFSWYVVNECSIYASTWLNGKNITMSKLLMPSGDLMTVDHKNGNTLDNQKSNLRWATDRQQAQNRKKRSDGKSRFKGVSPTKNGRWRARISTNTGRVNLGFFASEIEAAKAYNRAAIQEFGEFARLNEFDQPLSEAETK